MSAWTDRILREFPADLSRFWIACDPDDVLLDERILSGLRERGFDVLPFRDSILFRTEYEERYRAAWDRGDDGRAIVLQTQATDPGTLPWDYVRMGRTVGLSLADLFPHLSYAVVRQIDSEQHEALFVAHERHARQPHGDGSTKDFILLHLFKFSAHLLEGPTDLWREILRLHYRGSRLPPVLADHVAELLEAQPRLASLPVSDLLISRSFALKVLQEGWGRFVARLAGSKAHGADSPDEPGIPFDNPEIRALVDSYFLEGLLQPIALEMPAPILPAWTKVGLVEAPRDSAALVAAGIRRLAESLPSPDASHRDWLELARRLGEVLYRFHGLATEDAQPLAEDVRRLQQAVDAGLKAWVFGHFADLPSLPVARGPVMVHHVPRFLALRRNAGEDRIALLVFDGLGMDQWLQLRHHLEARVSGLTVEDGACFAWLPTLTSVSRQALFSGLKPRDFAGTIETTAQEATLWARFWQDNGLRAPQIAYQKGLKRTPQVAELEKILSRPDIKVAGIVVDMVDEIVHGATLGKRGIARQITEWCDTGFVETLLGMLSANGYHLYITADHGNVEAEGIGRPNEGTVSEIRGERVRSYRSKGLAEAASAFTGAFRFDTAGLPPDFLPLYADTRRAFVSRGHQVVAHGGISAEELIVPFVKVNWPR